MIAAQRGDIVVLADRAGRYTGKPRPGLVVQSDAFPGPDSVLVCLITSTVRDAPLLRVALPVGEQIGLQQRSWIQLEKLTAVAGTRSVSGSAPLPQLSCWTWGASSPCCSASVRAQADVVADQPH